MAYQTYQTTTRTGDAALAGFMRQVFNYMTGGVAVSGLVAWLTMNTPSLMALAATPVTAILNLVIWLGFGFLAHKIMFKLQPTAGLATFAAFSAWTGFALAPLVYMYTGASVTIAFFTAAIMFGGASLYGYTTNKSLSSWGTFLMLGMFGLIGAVLINVGLSFFGINTGPLSFITSLIAVPLIAAVTAYETNMLKETHYALQQQGDDAATRARVGIIGAVGLYTSFVALFVNLLQLLGQRDNG